MIPPLVASWCVNSAKNRVSPHIIDDISLAMKGARSTTRGTNSMCTAIPADGFDILTMGLAAPAWSATGKSRPRRLGHKDTYPRAGRGPLRPRGPHYWGHLDRRAPETCFDPRRRPRLVDNFPIPHAAGGLGAVKARRPGSSLEQLHQCGPGHTPRCREIAMSDIWIAPIGVGAIGDAHSKWKRLAW